MPGDITYYVTGPEMPPEIAEAILKRLGLDKPLWDQFLIYLKNTFTLDFGYSFRFATRPVISIIGDTLPRTLALLIPGNIIGVFVGYMLGVTAGWKPGSKTDSYITGSSLMLWAMPMFWTAMIALYVGGYWLEWFPLRGYRTIGVRFNFIEMIIDRIHHMILPWLTLATKFGVSELVMRNTMTIAIQQNYVVTAKAKGLSERKIKHRHAARNALLPLVTSTSLRLATMIAGLIFIETIFSYPGMGKLIYDAVQFQDYPVLQATFLIFAVVIIAMIFILDLIYARLDPRVRYE